ncbi:MAG: hypothetical protein EA366_16240, partial [Spirulina sp. DLM2.Bin59]
MILTLQFLLQVLGIVGLVGYFSYRSGEESINEIAHQLIDATAKTTEQELDRFFGNAHLVLETNQSLLKRQRLDAQNFADLEAHFFDMIKLYPEFTAMAFYTPQSQVIGVVIDRVGILTAPGTIATTEKLDVGLGTSHFYRLNDQGERIEHLFEVDHDPTERSWYGQAVESNQLDWTPIMALVTAPLGGILAFRSVQNEGQLQGVLAITLIINDISEFLRSLRLSPQSQVFIIEKSGNLVATSTEENVAPVTTVDGTNILTRLPAIESENPLTQATANALLAQAMPTETDQSWSFQFSAAVSGLENRQIFRGVGDPQRYFVNVTPYQNGTTLDWQIITVVPESDFMGAIYANLRRT